MLGRKQSLRGELLPYEVAQEETNNESVGVDWMNKVTHSARVASSLYLNVFSFQTLAMDETSLANERLALPVFRFLKHPQDL
jgi:hypothetical protein